MLLARTRKNPNHISECRKDKAFRFFLVVILSLTVVVLVYPLYFVLAASFSDPNIVNNGTILLWPRGVTFVGYQNILQNNSIWIGYRNSLIYVLVGTPLAVLITTLAAFAFSRRDMPFRKVLMPLYMFTMYFGGGLIPLYLVVRGIGLNNNPTVVVILGLFSVYNMIIARTYFSTAIPYEMQEAAMIDGCSIPRIFFSIVIPLSMPILCVLALYTAVSYWNSYFYAMIFLRKEEFFPLQLVLRRILLTGTAVEMTTRTVAQASASKSSLLTIATLAKYCVIVVTTIPMLVLYPFIQRYFIKGVMIGAVKG